MKEYGQPNIFHKRDEYYQGLKIFSENAAYVVQKVFWKKENFTLDKTMFFNYPALQLATVL